MSKYDSLEIWKNTLAKTLKVCQICNRPINVGDIYYCERLTDSRINFIGKKICSNCYEKMNMTKSRTIN